MKNQIVTSIRFLVCSTLILGAGYTALVTGLGKVVNPAGSTGSLVILGDHLRGSALLAQQTTSDRYFWSRPSAGDYATVASGASNLGPRSQSLKTAIDARRVEWTARHPGALTPPVEMITTSGSGLDPEVSPAAIRAQIPRVAAARGLAPGDLVRLLDKRIQGPSLGFIGTERVNVLQLNLDTDALSGGESKP